MKKKLKKRPVHTPQKFRIYPTLRKDGRGGREMQKK